VDTLVSLRVLDAVAELKSFTAASDRLGLSTAMATKHVQHVEARVGARLLNRTSRSVTLTEAGSIYLARMRPLLEGLAEVEAQLSQMAIKPSGRLRVSMPVWMATPRFAMLAAAFHRQCPDVILEIDPSSRIVNLVEEGFDLAIRVAMTLEPGLIARKLGGIQLVDLVELPASWHLDDAPPTMFVKAFPNSHGWITGSQLEEIWKNQFDWVYRHHDYAVFPITIHPDSAGKPHVLMVLERLIDYMMSHSGVRMMTFADMAEDFRRRSPFANPVELGGPSGL